VLAQAIHDASVRKDRPMIKGELCRAPAALIESELFGREKVLLPGRWRAGRPLRDCRRFAIFLDESANCRSNCSQKLVSCASEGEFERWVVADDQRSDARCNCSDQRPLAQAVSEGRFGRSIYGLMCFQWRYRRARAPRGHSLLSWTFVKEFSTRWAGVDAIADDSMVALLGYPWPRKHP